MNAIWMLSECRVPWRFWNAPQEQSLDNSYNVGYLQSVVIYNRHNVSFEVNAFLMLFERILDITKSRPSQSQMRQMKSDRTFSKQYKYIFSFCLSVIYACAWQIDHWDELSAVDWILRLMPLSTSSILTTLTKHWEDVQIALAHCEIPNQRR